MQTKLRSAILSLVGGATAITGLPQEARAMPIAPPATVSLSAPVEKVYFYRRYYRPYYGRVVYRRAFYPRYAYRRVYYRYPAYRYGYNPAGALFAGAALGLMGASLAAATGPGWGWGGWGPGWGWGGPGFGWGGPWGWGGGWGGGFGWGGPFWW